MAKHFSKADLKNQDVVTAELQKGFGWSIRHSKLVIIVVFGLVVFGGLAAIWQTFGDRKELQAQTRYYPIEKTYVDKKQKFEEAQTKALHPPADAAENEKNLAKDKLSKKDKKELVTSKAVTTPIEGLASGDMEKDYGSDIKGFQDLIHNYPSSKAAKMSALMLSEIYAKYEKDDMAINVLKDIHGSNDLLSILAKDRQASLLADSGKCDEASSVWTTVKNEPNAKFLKDDIQMREGVCFMGGKKYAQAETAFKSLDPKGASYSKAEKWLRLIPQDANAAPTAKK